MAKNCQNTKSIIRGFSSILGNLKKNNIMISLECADDSESNDAINVIVSCSVVELFIIEITKIPQYYAERFG